MNDLISRQAAVKALQDKVFHNLSDEFYGTMQVLDELPPVDAETVVRCKDCDFVDTLDCPMNYIDKQRQMFTNRSPDWFCAEGRRKENKK